MNRRASTTLKIVGFFSIVIGGAAVAFGPTNSIKIIGGLLITVGTGFVSLS